jgi:IS5 family transposase
MLKDESKQAKFLYGPSVYEKIVPKNHFLRKLDACVDWKRIDALCHHLYCEDNGRPVTNPPRKMFKAEILQFLYNWSDREMEEHARYHIAVKWFLELDLEEEPFDHSALSKFRAKLGVTMHTELFCEMNQQIREAGLWDFEVQFVDATDVRGDVALSGTKELIRVCCLNLKRALEDVHPVLLTFEKKESLQRIVEKASLLLEESSDIPEVEHEREILKRILKDYVEVEVTSGKVTERKKKGKGRIVSPTDLDVRLGAKSNTKIWAGYKVHNMMTERRFITSVITTPANVTDDKELVPLYDRQEDTPSTVAGDGLFGTGENRIAFKERECELVAPVRSQKNRTGKFPKSKFQWNGDTVTCPAGKTTSACTDNKKAKAYVFRFSREECENCQLRPQCTTNTYRSVSISYFQKEFDEAEQFNATERGKTLQKKRTSIESKYAEMKNIHGLKRARYRGINRVTIQVLITAIVVNLKNFIRLLTEKPLSQRKQSICAG